ncbi:hypothetical protein TKK_0017734 [Trichogramma kaykai]
MENRENSVRVKEESNDTPLDAGDDYVFNSVDSCEVKNLKTFNFYQSLDNHVNEVMLVRKKFNENRSIEFECKNVKPELKIFPTTICKSEYQDLQTIVKIENENQINDMNGDIFIGFECKDVKPELVFFSTTICKTEYQSYLPIKKVDNEIQTVFMNKNNENSQFQERSQLKIGESKEVEIFAKRTKIELSAVTDSSNWNRN